MINIRNKRGINKKNAQIFKYYKKTWTLLWILQSILTDLLWFHSVNHKRNDKTSNFIHRAFCFSHAFLLVYFKNRFLVYTQACLVLLMYWHGYCCKNASISAIYLFLKSVITICDKFLITLWSCCSHFYFLLISVLMMNLFPFFFHWSLFVSL